MCQEDPYLLELVRYIHLNPLRAGIVSDMNQLDAYPFSGHGVLMGKEKYEWQDTDDVLVRFGKGASEARYRYRQFVEKGSALGQRSDLIGGGLVRSTGGWSAVKQLRRENALAKGDERILGNGDFVEAVLAHATETLNRKHHLRTKNIDLETIIQRIGELLDMTREEVLFAGKNPRTVHASSLCVIRQ